MYPKANALIKLQFLVSTSHQFLSTGKNRVVRRALFCTTTTYSTLCQTHGETVAESSKDYPQDAAEVLKGSGCSQPQFEILVEEGAKDSIGVLKQWGCSEDDVSKLILRRPSLRCADVVQLQSKLNILSGLGLTSSDLVRIIHCRPRFLSCRINHCFDERIHYFMTLFGSREVLHKAIIRNPSLLTYDLHNKIKPVVALYEEMGIDREDLIPMLLSRPTLIPRTSFNDEKMEYIRKTGVSKYSKMFKYVATIIGISRLDTIREKVANFEKFGFSDDIVWGLFGRSPLILTLSVDKVQRNMTFVLATMKLPATVVLEHPFLLFNNLEAVLKPRFLLAEKIDEMNIQPQIKGPTMLTALRMKEKRFLKAFITCHPEDVVNDLMEFYKNAKCIKRLAEASKKVVHKGFPF
ncbi:uncharacterized protein LOC110816635 [Carica papaya]|uniref:uncharacterized protein LOC110816635 n=1 Tax=Carica papaya TaxID=3649 RepID=UPI000B8C92B0|nr:uncharacterized protein LOC110816635 [Carica papaya]XP_021900589.1 uncharacterized protein LOC110816635 [Carica papaya]XP_021900590.1 uncharacterized protein LOC110816635 [Carica papaya]XP_021900591.1 uncharacterized protein LOC110816635 [Carica papaya]XP_021900592.1 uncharacterized protein LOC110816635 [Carica papaya]